MVVTYIVELISTSCTHHTICMIIMARMLVLWPWKHSVKTCIPVTTTLFFCAETCTTGRTSGFVFRCASVHDIYISSSYILDNYRSCLCTHMCVSLLIGRWVFLIYFVYIRTVSGQNIRHERFSEPLPKMQTSFQATRSERRRQWVLLCLYFHEFMVTAHTESTSS